MTDPGGGSTGVRWQPRRGWVATFLFPLPCWLALIPLLFGGCGNRLVFTPKTGEGKTPANYGMVYREITLSPCDEVTLTGWFVEGSKDRPLIVAFHGNKSNLSDCLDYLRLFHRLGFPVCAIDYRGHGKSTGTPVTEEGYYQDGRAVLGYLQREGWSRRRMIYFGQSLGAAVALQMALEQPPAGLVLDSPFTNIPEIARHLAPVGYRLIGWWNIDARFDNLAKIGGIAVPLLVVQADDDPVVPLQMALRLFSLAPEPKRLHVYRDSRHCAAPAADGDGLAEALLTFYSEIRGACDPTERHHEGKELTRVTATKQAE